MRYFKKIDIESLSEIIEGTLRYLKTEVPDIYSRTYNTTYYPLELAKLLEYCPHLLTAFDDYGLKCNLAVAYIMYNNSHSSIHIDAYTHDAKINIPVQNCEGTKTLFFAGGTYENVHNSMTKTNAKKIKSTENLKLVDYVEIDQTTVVRVNEPHTVVMDMKRTPRITLSLGFDKDPVFLLED